MKRFFLITFIICCIIAVAALPFFIDKSITDKLNISFSIVSSITSLITLSIAFILFNKFGIENKLLEKNLDTVEALITELRKINILFFEEDSMIQLIPLQREFYWDRKKFKDYIVIFSQDSIEVLNRISEFTYNPFLPKSIAQNIKPLEFMFGNLAMFEENVKVFKAQIFSRSITRSEKSDSEKVYMSFNNERVTFEEYQNRWRKLSSSIHQWLKNNSSLKKEINLEL